MKRLLFTFLLCLPFCVYGMERDVIQDPEGFVSICCAEHHKHQPLYSYVRFFVQLKRTKTDELNGELQLALYFAAEAMRRNLQVKYCKGTNGMMVVDIDGSRTKDQFDEKTGTVPSEVIETVREVFKNAGFDEAWSWKEYGEYLKAQNNKDS